MELSRHDSAVPEPVPPDSSRVVEPVPPAPSGTAPHAPPPVLPAYRVGREIWLRRDARLPGQACIRCGRPADRPLLATLRHPRRPWTWFGRRPALEVGLCRKHHEDHSVAVALTWSLLALGMLLAIVGLLTRGLFTGILGLALAGVSGAFRAASPIGAEGGGDAPLRLEGAGERYLRLLPEPRPPDRAPGDRSAHHEMW